MPLTPHDWHRRFTQQATWTAELRRHLFNKIGIQRARRVIEIGCGTAAVLASVQALGPESVFGLDIAGDYLALAGEAAPNANLTQADGRQTPFPDAVFDVTYCHYLLLWVPGPEALVAEMARITRPGGAVLALAEPDYGGRIDYPSEFQNLGRQQAEALRRQGADAEVGRKLAALLNHAGLREVETGVLGGHWSQPPDPGELSLEWAVVENDLGGMIPDEDLKQLRALDAVAWERRERILYVPTFYARGIK